MISTAEALDHLLALVAPMPVEEIALQDAFGRVLAEPAVAARAQPPFPASAMDGYAITDAKPEPGTRYTVIGEAAAGHAYTGDLHTGQAVRIFTGAPVPNNAKSVVIQEDVTRNGDEITLSADLERADHIRPAGGDFNIGATLDAPRRLRAADLALMASMNLSVVPVRRKPVIALIATGDELVMPGEMPRDDQIIASNTFGLKAMFETRGAEVRVLPIAKDTVSSLATVLQMAEGCDLAITIGGASVGDHDLVAQVAGELGLDRSFYKVAMRPGKPLMAGHLQGAAMVGLPGNPVSSMVCGEIFVSPMIDKMLGMPAGPRPRDTAVLSEPLGQNGPREHYMRARLGPEGVAAFHRQDSSLLSVLADANALIVRPPHDGPREIGAQVDVIHI
ncbi:MAG: molybdopterin molybdotransferase MoeA [Litoreibacter sp.]|nr:molybdopterin molybdotransferase MoeA [Litoreibacter sp.]